MTKEKAISVLEQAELKVGIKWRNGRPEVYISPYLQEAINFALTKLHPISREQVEKTSRGEWLGDILYPYLKCSVCGDSAHYVNVISGWLKYCPNCGAKMKKRTR